MTNTTFQRISKKDNAVIVSGVPSGYGASVEDHYETGGTFTVNGTNVITVSEPKVTAYSAIVITLKTVGGTVSPSLPYISTITAGTGFTVVATASDTSTYNYLVIG